MASRFVEAVMRIRSEGGNIAQVAKDADAASTSMGRLTTAIGVLSAATGIVIGFSRALGTATTEAAKTADQMVRLGLLTDDQAKRLKDNAAEWKATTTAWEGLKASILSSSAVKDFFTGVGAAALVAQGHVGDLRKEVTRLQDETRIASRRVTSSVIANEVLVDGVWMTPEQAARAEAEAERRRGESERRRDEALRAETAAAEALRAARLFQAEQGRRMREFEAGLGPDGLPLAGGGVAANAGLDIAGLSTTKLEEVAEAHRATAEEIVGIWGMATGQILAGLGGFFAKNEALQKASAVTSIAISTAAAIMQAFRIYGPTPVGYAAAGMMLIAGGVQAAAALAGKMPGGVGGRAGGGSGLDHVDAPLTRREERMMRREARANEEAGDRRGAPRMRGEGATIFALNTRELARELRKLGAFNVALAPE